MDRLVIVDGSSAWLRWLKEAGIDCRRNLAGQCLVPSWARRVAKEENYPVCFRRRMLKELRRGSEENRRAVIALMDLGAFRAGLEHLGITTTLMMERQHFDREGRALRAGGDLVGKYVTYDDRLAPPYREATLQEYDEMTEEEY